MIPSTRQEQTLEGQLQEQAESALGYLRGPDHPNLELTGLKFGLMNRDDINLGVCVRIFACKDNSRSQAKNYLPQNYTLYQSKPITEFLARIQEILETAGLKYLEEPQ